MLRVWAVITSAAVLDEQRVTEHVAQAAQGWETAEL